MTTYTLTKHSRIPATLVFTHDPDARTVAGPDADLVRSMLESWDGIGVIYGTQSAPAPDPLGSTRDMCIFLHGWGWPLPDELSALIPAPEPIPDGSVA